MKDREKAKEFVSKIEETIDMKFVEKALILATKQDLSETNVEHHQMDGRYVDNSNGGNRFYDSKK